MKTYITYRSAEENARTALISELFKDDPKIQQLANWLISSNPQATVLEFLGLLFAVIKLDGDIE